MVNIPLFTGFHGFIHPRWCRISEPSTVGSMYSIFTYMWLIFMVNVGKYTIHGSYGIVHLKIRRWKRRFLLETSIFRWTMLNFGGVFLHLLFIVISISREDCLYLADMFQTSWNHQPVENWQNTHQQRHDTWKISHEIIKKFSIFINPH